MTRSGKKGRVGHLPKVQGEDRSFCGRRLRITEFFTDASQPPVMCKVCAKAFEKIEGADHHHLCFRDGRWVVSIPRRRYAGGIQNGAVFYSAVYSSRCGIDGCDRMVKHTSPSWTVSGCTLSNNYTSSTNYSGQWWAA